MAVPKKHLVKAAIADIAFRPFRDDVMIPFVEKYRLIESTGCSMQLSVLTKDGEHCNFEIKVSERY